jgi:UDP-N-acetylglucosamine--N-acetylmuramyl-(pentapeptide) pyrophosphoryl-undecaprenol N-acetylglucosamine transferase
MQNKATPDPSSGGFRLVMAGGGTGGHLFPAIAIAQAFRLRHPGNRVLFVNAGRSLETRVLSELGWEQKAISIEGIKGRGLWRQFAAVSKVPWAIWQAGGILKAFRADLVFGVGGYSAGPVVAAAVMRGLPTALHEQNRVPGVTNRLLGRMVDQIYLTFEESRELFNPEKVTVSGNPVRDEIVALALEPVAANHGDAFTVLVVGGSQGAQAINTAVVEALPDLKAMRHLRFVHQTGIADEPAVRKAYEDNGIQAVAKSFFSDMATQYQAADMILCRAGATTVAEITAIGKAAIFVPFPFATDDHQTMNAQALVDFGAAEMIRQEELEGGALAALIKGYMENRILLRDMAAKAKVLGRPKAALTVVDGLYRMLEQ